MYKLIVLKYNISIYIYTYLRVLCFSFSPYHSTLYINFFVHIRYTSIMLTASPLCVPSRAHACMDLKTRGLAHETSTPQPPRARVPPSFARFYALKKYCLYMLYASFNRLLWAAHTRRHTQSRILFLALSSTPSFRQSVRRYIYVLIM